MSKLKNFIKSISPEFALQIKRSIFKNRSLESIRRFRFDGGSIEQDLKEKYDYDGDLGRLYASHEGNLIHKWHHYIPIYDNFFEKYRNTNVRFLEIGVSKGGSLALWRRYFGDEAILYGIDIDESCRQFDGVDAQVRIGSQADATFLKSVIAEMGGVDIVLDDGSHQMSHIRKSLDVLYPEVSEGGLYVIEDLHTAYWSGFGGGLRSKNNFFSFVREVIDDLHQPYHGQALKHSQLAKHLGGMHIYDSIVVLEKMRTYQPTHSQVS